ncbi:MAG: pyridoxamine 5'-phosphate oxidase [Thermoleophilaceae bacterium]
MEERDLSEMRRAYRADTLARADLADSWLVQLERWLEEAVQSDIAEPNAMVLATADVDRAPSARTVLLKGLDDRGLTFFTNLRSRKGQELGANPRATALFPWIALQRQVIVEGTVEPVDDQTSDEYFASRPHGSRVAASVSPQSTPVDSREELEALYQRAATEHPGDVPRPAWWGGLRLKPDTVEFWQGRPDRLHDRLRYRHTVGEWVVERLAP